MAKRATIQTLVFSASIVVLAGFVLLKVFAPDTYSRIIGEDNVVEYFQFLAYVTCSAIAAALAVLFHRRSRPAFGVFYLVLTLGFLFVALEEISWGQRLLGFPTPEYLRGRNEQGELTLHNLKAMKSYLWRIYILVGAFGTFAWLAVPKLAREKYKDAVDHCVPGWYLMPYFAPVLFIYLYFGLASKIPPGDPNLSHLRVGNFIVHMDQEPAEMLLSTGVLLFLMTNLIREKTDPRSG